MPSKKFTKICTVCGEKAIGFNFGAISCESCKAFFRRNASKFSQYTCTFESKCQIDQGSRKFCRKCRLKKCFAVGMRQEWILNDEEREERRIKIQKNKRFKQLVNKSADNFNESSVSSHNESIISDDVQHFEGNDISDEEIINNIMEIERYVSNDQNHRTNQIIEYKGEEIDEISDITYQKAVELELADLPIPRTINDFLNLNDVECNRLSELLKASLFFQTTYPSNAVLETSSFEDLVKFFFVKFECFTQKFVNVVKSLDSFANICENDQIALVKYSSLEVLLMRTALHYNYEKEQWTFNMDSNNAIIFKLDVLKNSKRNVYPIFKSYLHKIGREWDNDYLILDLLMAIILFNPERPHLIHKEAIKLQQQLYMYLLQRYLLIKYKTECQSKVKFLRILNVIKDVQELHQIHRINYKEVNSEYFGPLLKEILDITPENDSKLL